MFCVKMRAVIAIILNLNIALYFTTGVTAYQQNTLPTGTRLAVPYTYGRNAIFRARRDSSVTEHHVIDSAQDCMLITSDEGHFFYKSVTDESTVCGIFMITDPTKRVEMVFTFLDVPCESSGLVAWIDGWELNGQYFPAPGDHPRPMDDRFAEFCGARRIKQVFISSQNVALLQYRVPAKGKGFSITVRHVKNPAPCNVLLYDVEDIYTLRNYGKASNCSLSTVFPASVRVVALSVGVASARTSWEVETGTIHKCQKRGLPDYVEIGGSAGFDNINLEKVDTVCGLDSTPARSLASIFCEVTTVRLVSGGQFENSVTIGVKKLGMDDIMDATLVCGM